MFIAHRCFTFSATFTGFPTPLDCLSITQMTRTCYFYPTRTISSHSFFLNNQSRSKLNSKHVLDRVLCRMMTHNLLVWRTILNKWFRSFVTQYTTLLPFIKTLRTSADRRMRKLAARHPRCVQSICSDLFSKRLSWLCPLEIVQIISMYVYSLKLIDCRWFQAYLYSKYS